ncbi:MAG: 2Fe-2S iron-sulfur cluster-binding protein [Spirochaetota bacterium]|nr:2Fe-2S iron-sulfur cluster-binding protein [Spirochaetota bacterium]
MKAVSIILGDQKVNINVLSDQSILDAGIQAGIDLPFFCQSGICGTCKAKLLSGDVYMETNDALTDKKIAEGHILVCQAHPETDDVVIEYEKD